MLHCEHDRLEEWFAAAPVYGRVFAHVVADNFILVKQLDELWLFDVFVDLVCRKVRRVHCFTGRAVSLNFSEYLLLSLNLEDHLHVNILNVEVLFSDDQGASI